MTGAGAFFLPPQMRTIHRLETPTRDFTILPNALLRKKNLSYRARGILAMVLSNADEWVTTHSWLEENGTEGKEAIRSALNELEAAGHLVRSRTTAFGRFTGYLMVWHIEPVEPQAGNPSCDGDYGTPQDGKPVSGILTTKKDNNTKKKIEGDFSKSSIQESEPPPASAPAPAPTPKEKAPRKIYPMGCAPADPVELDLTAPEEVKRIWRAWEKYRTGRHEAGTAKERLAWTPLCAKLAADEINAAALTISPADIVAAVTKAILSGWKTFYLTPTNTHTKGKTNGAQHQQSGGRKFAALGNQAVEEYETDLTGEIR